MPEVITSALRRIYLIKQNFHARFLVALSNIFDRKFIIRQDYAILCNVSWKMVGRNVIIQILSLFWYESILFYIGYDVIYHFNKTFRWTKIFLKNKKIYYKLRII